MTLPQDNQISEQVSKNTCRKLHWPDQPDHFDKSTDKEGKCNIRIDLPGTGMYYMEAKHLPSAQGQVWVAVHSVKRDIAEKAKGGFPLVMSQEALGILREKASMVQIIKYFWNHVSW